MDHFNNPSHFVHNTESVSHQHNTDDFFSGTSNINGFDTGVANNAPYAQSWGVAHDRVNAHGTSNTPWTNTAAPHLSSNNAIFGQENGLNAPLVADRSSFHHGDNFGSGDGFGHEQTQYNTSGISPATLTHHNQSNGQPNGSSNSAQSNTISPEALQSRPMSHSTNTLSGQSNIRSVSSAQSLSALQPKGMASGKFTVTSVDSVKEMTNVRPIHRYVDVATESVNLPISSSNIPNYVPRKSRNQIKQMLGSNQGYTATISKKLSSGSGSAKSVTLATYVDASGKLSTKAGKLEQQSSTEGSSEESEYESSDEEPEKPPYPAARPTTPKEAVRYDAMKASWRPAGDTVSTESIRDGLKRLWEVLQTIRDRWKSDLATLADAEKAKKDDELPLLRDRVKTQRDLLEVALKAAIQHGHPDILDNFGQVMPAMGAFASLLQDRIKDTDYNGSFTRAILEFLVRCKSLDTGSLDKSAISRMLLRFSKRGDDDIKALSKRITNNASAATKKSKEAKAAPPSSTTATAAKATDQPRKAGATATTGTKRPLADGTASDQPAKRIANGGSDSSGKATKTGAGSPGSKAAATAINATAKQRTNSVAAKPSAFVASLQAAKRAPAPTTKPAPAKTAPEKKAPVQTDKPAAFSFASVLADVAKPKEVKLVETKRDEQLPKETPEEKTKRLRKEARRKLRVKFKPESSLVEVKYFTHDPEEDLGHDSSQTRDVGDTRSEGKMLKMQSQLMEIDEDEDGDVFGTLFSREWREPSLVDFSDVSDEMKAITYAPYGGGVEVPENTDKAIQEEREASTLGVYYTDPSEIPMNPKEPPADVMDDAPEMMQFGEVPEQVMNRIEEVKNRPPPAPANPQEIVALLHSLQNNPALNQQQQRPAAPAPMMGGPPQMPPFNPMNPMVAQQPNPAFPPNPTGGAPDLSAIMSAMTQTRQPGYPPASGPPSGGQDLNAILAALSSNNQLQQQQPVGMPPNMTGMSYLAPAGHIPQIPPIMGSAPPPDQSSGGPPYENEERRRWRMQNGGSSSDDSNVNGYQPRDQSRGNKEGGNLPFRVKPCTYWLAGKCNKGDRCTFLHSMPE